MDRMGRRLGLCLEGKAWQRSSSLPSKVQVSGCGGLGVLHHTAQEGRWRLLRSAYRRNPERRASQQQAWAGRAEGHRHASARRERRRWNPHPPRPEPAARLPQPGAGALGSFRRRRCRALPRTLRHLRQFPSGPGRHFLAACVSRWLRGSVLVSEAFVRFGNGRVCKGASEEVCEREVGLFFGPVRGRPRNPPAAPPRAGLPLPNRRPIAHTPPFAFPAGSGRENGEKAGSAAGEALGRWRGRRPQSGRGLGGGGWGGKPRASRRSLPPPGAISIRNLGPEPRAGGSCGSECGGREAGLFGGPRGERREALRRPSADPDLCGLARPALAEGDAGGGSSGRAPGSRGGRGARGRDATLLCFHWSLVVGAGGREKCLFVGPKNIQGLAKGPRN